MDIKQETMISATTYSFDEENAKTAHNREASFPGGQQVFEAYIAENLDLDDLIKDERTYITFTINTDGSVSNAKILGDDNKDINVRIKKVFEASPKWIPKQEDGKPVQISTSYLYHKKTK